jgi:hypothetical protein
MYPRFEFHSSSEAPSVVIKKSMGTKNESQHWQAKMADISASGLALSLSEKTDISLGDCLTFEMNPMGEETFQCQGKVVRSKVSEDSHAIGIEFTDLPLIYQARLKTKIEIALQKRQESRTREYEGSFKFEKSKLFYLLLAIGIPTVIAIASQSQWLGGTVRGLKLLLNL